MPSSVSVLAEATGQTAAAFVEQMTDSTCSICCLKDEELRRWDSGGTVEQTPILTDLLVAIEARGDASVMLHDERRLLVCLGKKTAVGWEFLPFDRAHRPSIDTFLKRR